MIHLLTPGGKEMKITTKLNQVLNVKSNVYKLVRFAKSGTLIDKFENHDWFWCLLTISRLYICSSTIFIFEKFSLQKLSFIECKIVVKLPRISAATIRANFWRKDFAQPQMAKFCIFIWPKIFFHILKWDFHLYWGTHQRLAARTLGFAPEWLIFGTHSPLNILY